MRGDLLRPIEIAIGQFALTWNDLHEKLGTLFSLVMGGEYVDQYVAIWDALQNDRAKRAVLLAALLAKDVSEAGNLHKMVEDIEWIVHQANVLENSSSDSRHSALAVTCDYFLNERPLVQSWNSNIRLHVMPNVTLENYRARKMADKEIYKKLLDEFRWRRDIAIELRNFSISVDVALSDSLYPWPNRPVLRALRQSKKHL